MEPEGLIQATSGGGAMRRSKAFWGMFSASVIFVSMATGCGGGSGGGTSERVVEKPTCDPKPDIGTLAIAENAKKTDWVQSAFFGKPYDRYDLEAVLNASANSTSSYVQSLGINANRIPSGQAGSICPTYYTLPLASGEFTKIWSDVSGGGATGGGTLAGLFFEYCGQGSSACRDREMVNPTILVAEQGDRWTLVHEMMHYNFNQGRKADLSIPTSMQLDRAQKVHAQNYNQFLSDYTKLPNRGDLAQTVAELRGLIETGKAIFVRRALEEVTIEGMLLGLWSEGIFQNVSVNSGHSAIWYMDFSRQGFVQSLAPYPALISKLKVEADANFWQEISTELVNLTQLLESYKSETNDMIETAKAKFKAKTGRDFEPLLAPKSGLAYFSTEASFNVVDFDQELRNHLASHDVDGLQKSLEDSIRQISEFTANITTSVAN